MYKQRKRTKHAVFFIKCDLMIPTWKREQEKKKWIRKWNKKLVHRRVAYIIGVATGAYDSINVYTFECMSSARRFRERKINWCVFRRKTQSRLSVVKNTRNYEIVHYYVCTARKWKTWSRTTRDIQTLFTNIYTKVPIEFQKRHKSTEKRLQYGFRHVRQTH